MSRTRIALLAALLIPAAGVQAADMSSVTAYLATTPGLKSWLLMVSIVGLVLVTIGRAKRLRH